MNYYVDFEYMKDTKRETVLGLPIGNIMYSPQFICLGMISEDNRKFFAVSDEFSLKEAWNRADDDFYIRNVVLRFIYVIYNDKKSSSRKKSNNFKRKCLILK